MENQTEQEHLDRRQDSKPASRVLTLKEAKEKGIGWRSEPPKPGKCRFCGKELQPQGLLFGAEIVYWNSNLERCDCKQAKAYWEQHDKKETERQAAEKEAERQRIMQDRIDRVLGKAGIKKRFRQRTFENFRTDTPERKKCYQIAKSYADNFAYHRDNGDGLYIEGTNGTGKTHLAAAIALQLLKAGIPVICKTSGDMLGDIKKAFEGEGATESQVLDVYKNTELLIIDDLGKEQCTDWSMSTLYAILNDRYESMKPTIVTTNYNTDGLIQALTPKGMDATKIIAIVSRLRETSTVMTMAWQDARGSH